MRIFIKRAAVILLAAVTAAMLAACSGGMGMPNTEKTPAGSPAATGRASAVPSASAEASVSPGNFSSPEASSSPGNSAEASGSPAGSSEPSDDEKTDITGMLEGFMEGVVVDPAEAPELVRLLSSKEEYRDMTVQSITYKMFEDRRAFYVILQGEGEASHPVYVFADGTVRDEG